MKVAPFRAKDHRVILQLEADANRLERYALDPYWSQAAYRLLLMVARELRAQAEEHQKRDGSA